MKKIWVLLLLLLTFSLISCDENSIMLPNLTNLSREEIDDVLNDYDINYIFRFSDKIIESDDMLDKFVSYGNGYKTGNFFSKSDTLIIYTTVLPLNINYSKDLTLDIDYDGKSFINDGIGEVKLVSCTDGDTARFQDIITGEVFRLRFLGIDTPEVYAGEDPWGQQASKFTKQKLQNAKTIVLEAEGARKETYDRYLGFVWVDGVLLNLEIVEEAYSNSTLNSSKYSSVFMKASIDAMKTGRRFHGETDPLYDYEKKRFY